MAMEGYDSTLTRINISFHKHPVGTMLCNDKSLLRRGWLTLETVAMRQAGGASAIGVLSGVDQRDVCELCVTR